MTLIWCGCLQFCKLSAKLAFGEGSAVLREQRNATVQSLSGTGSLRVRPRSPYPAHNCVPSHDVCSDRP